jgi:hypothetical protein
VARRVSFSPAVLAGSMLASLVLSVDFKSSIGFFGNSRHGGRPVLKLGELRHLLYVVIHELVFFLKGDARMTC